MKKFFLVSLSLLLSGYTWAQDKNSTSTQVVVTDHGHIVRIRHAEKHSMHRLMELSVGSRQIAAQQRFLRASFSSIHRVSRINRLVTKWPMKVGMRFHKALLKMEMRSWRRWG